MNQMFLQYYEIKMFYFCKNSGTIDLGHNCYLSSFEERKYGNIQTTNKILLLQSSKDRD